MKYAIYCKLPEYKNWYPYSDGGITKKMIYAMLWDDKDIASKACESLSALNPDLKFEVRKI